jgi:adenylate kinase family enzyme
LQLDRLVVEFLDANPRCERTGFILHGLPLDTQQAQRLFAHPRCQPTRVVELEVPEPVLDKRLGLQLFPSSYEPLTCFATLKRVD